ELRITFARSSEGCAKPVQIPCSFRRCFGHWLICGGTWTGLSPKSLRSSDSVNKLARGEGRRLATKSTKNTERSMSVVLTSVLFVPFVANLLPYPWDTVSP